MRNHCTQWEYKWIVLWNPVYTWGEVLGKAAQWMYHIISGVDCKLHEDRDLVIPTVHSVNSKETHTWLVEYLPSKEGFQWRVLLRGYGIVNSSVFIWLLFYTFWFAIVQGISYSLVEYESQSCWTTRCGFWNPSRTTAKSVRSKNCH